MFRIPLVSQIKGIKMIKGGNKLIRFASIIYFGILLAAETLLSLVKRGSCLHEGILFKVYYWRKGKHISKYVVKIIIFK